jgi:RHS repeat-associated protein
MSLDAGFDSQVPSLPQGGGAVGGLGATFAADLSTGTGSYRVPLDIPNGPNDIGPRLALAYNTASGNGPFGMGFSLMPLPRLLRSTAQGYPRYDDTDTLTLEGVGDLVRLGGGAFRPQVDAGAWRVAASGSGFQATDREGLFYFFGTDPSGRLTGTGSDAGKVFAWHLQRIEDSLGNAVTFTWMRDANQLYLSSIAYGAYLVAFKYGARPDRVRWARAGFPIHTAQRCASIELRMPSDPQPLLRRWTLSYTEDAANRCSLMTQIVLSGFGPDMTQLDAPKLQMGYTGFQTRALVRFTTQDPGAAPGPLTRPARRVDLLDWNADGLPDLIEVEAGGMTRVWPNRGDCTWGRPEQVGGLPWFAQADAPIAFADMNGDGIADLIRVDRPLGSFIPRGTTGFGQPITFRRAPSQTPGQPNCRLTDLDGDGIVDLLASSDDYLSLSFRTDPDGWQPRPMTVPRGIAPDVNLADPHVFLADMTGDGSDDLVRVDGGGATYWPYLGPGRWDAPVAMTTPPALPFDVDPRRLFLTDIDGDGCADLLYIGQQQVLYWINQQGNGFGPQRTINDVPTGQLSDIRLADMRGSGTAGILWSAPGPFGRGTNYFYLDFTGGAKPYLLATIDNGIGKTTEIAYTTSAEEAAADTQAGAPWSTTLPVAVPVIASVTATYAATAQQSIIRYRWHNGRFDGVLREFAGFGHVDEDQVGDASIPTLRTTSWFNIGVDPANPTALLTRDDRSRLRAIRGRLYRQERYGLDGSPQQGLAYDRLEQTWTVQTENTAGSPVHRPQLTTILRSTVERNIIAAATLRTDNVSFDANGNVTESVQTSQERGHPERAQVLRTRTSFAADPTGRFPAKPSRVQQFDGSNTVVADTTTEYDGLPLGQIGRQGLVTRRAALVLSDAMVVDLYGSSPPDFASLGYFRRSGETGWWVVQAEYQRIVDTSGLHGRTIAASGAVTLFEFDRAQTFPVRIQDALGNTTSAEHDYRVCRVKQLTDAGGSVYQASYDPLARPLAVIEPDDSAALPTHAWEYGAALPVEATLRQRAESAAAATIVTREIFDGDGRLLERRLLDDGGELVAVSSIYNARGLLLRAYQERRPTSATYAMPDDTWPHVAYEYDSLGRPVRQTNIDGSTRTRVYEALSVLESDEEDNRIGPGAMHAGTPTTRRMFATGQVRAVEENLTGRTIASTYAYDVKGNLTQHTDALGNVVTLTYDLLGRTVRAVRPEHSTVSVFDADGNAVEARGPAGTLVIREFDPLKRPLTARFLSPTNPPVIRFTYHNTNGPAPPDAGAHTLGHLVRIEDQGGTTVFDYDERGRTALKRSTPTGSTTSYELRVAYRADGQWAGITYPDKSVVTYGYNTRGLVDSVSGVVSGIDYDVAGRRTAIRYANGTVATIGYDASTGRLQSQLITGPGGILRSTAFTTDLVGNLLRIDSPDPTLGAIYTYDDLYRLTDATTHSGDSLQCQYDDAANLTFKSDIGGYRYGENGAPSTCLTTAGPQNFTYTNLGEMQTTPWGIQSFDPMGRLVRIQSADGSGAVDFTYDFAGNRVSAKSSGTAPVTDRVTPDPLYAIESGQLVLHVFDGLGICARQPSGGPLAFLHTDHLGSLVVVTDSSGAVTDTIRYDPFGTVRARTGGGAPPPLGFTGGTQEAFSGLLYLTARYYNPLLGRFVSPDASVQDVLDPAAWAPYTYCRNNPTSFVDPGGRSFWGIFLAALAIVALIVVVAVCVVLDVFSFGTLTPALAIGIIALGSVVGGVVGGLAASAKGGNTDDIVTGVLVGAAVGGWAAFFSLFAGAAVAGAAHLTAGSFGFGVVAGAVNGTINGAAIGFASGFAGGKGSLNDILTKVWQGALAGAITGAVVGGLSSIIKPPSDSLTKTVNDALKPQPPSGAAAGPTGTGLNANFPPTAPPSYTNDFGTALSTVGTKLGTQVGGAVGGWVAQTAISGPLAPLVSIIAIDAVAGAWDLGYVPWILNKIGVIKSPQVKF